MCCNTYQIPYENLSCKTAKTLLQYLDMLFAEIRAINEVLNFASAKWYNLLEMNNNFFFVQEYQPEWLLPPESEVAKVGITFLPKSYKKTLMIV